MRVQEFKRFREKTKGFMRRIEACGSTVWEDGNEGTATLTIIAGTSWRT
jgi:hypothetical protein